MWVYLKDLACGGMVEFGRELPLAAEEDAWRAALPADLCTALIALAAKGAKD